VVFHHRQVRIMKLKHVLGISALLALVLSTPAIAAVQGTPKARRSDSSGVDRIPAWPMRFSDASRSCRTSAIGASMGTVQWSQLVQGSVFDFAIDGTGIVFVGTIFHGEFWTNDTWAYAYRPDGSVHFRAKVEPYAWGASQGVDSAPLLDSAGRLVFNSSNGQIVALNAGEGTPLWKLQRRSTATNDCAPALLPDGSIVHQQLTEGLASIRASDGVIQWVNNGVVSTSSGVAVAPNGDMAMGGSFHNENHGFPAVYYINADGTTRWIVETGRGDGDTPSFGPDGTLYVTIGGARAYAPDGTLIWSQSVGGGTPGLDSQGRLYAKAGASVAVLDASNGNVLYTVLTPGTVQEGVAIDGDDNLFVTTVTGYVASYAPGGTPRFEARVCDAFTTAPAVAGHGRIVAAGNVGFDTFLFSIE
jgi:outer membrane protein assembly factor BamB